MSESDIAVLNFLYNRGYTDMSCLKQLLLRCKNDCINPVNITRWISHTRSIHNGKGERELSYRMILELFSVFPSAGVDALRRVIMVDGGLNDVKRFCTFVDKHDFDCEPMVSLAISLGNSALREGGFGKWIPRERGHKELYDRFVRDWFGTACVTNGMRQEYRYILSGLSGEVIEKSCVSKSYATKFVGEYFKAGLGGSADANTSWSDLLRIIGNCCSGCIPIVDIDIEIRKDNLFHALGFACLIAHKSGAFRVLLISGEPIWVDLSGLSGDFCAMTALLWDHCEMRTRSRMSAGLELIYRATSAASATGSGDDMHPMRLVFFSETFDFDWHEWVPRFSCPIVFWNIGCRATIPSDFYLDDHKGLSLASGFMPRLVSSCNGVLIGSFDDVSEGSSKDSSKGSPSS